jgi:hypothetical protein
MVVLRNINIKLPQQWQDAVTLQQLWEEIRKSGRSTNTSNSYTFTNFLRRWSQTKTMPTGCWINPGRRHRISNEQDRVIWQPFKNWQPWLPRFVPMNLVTSTRLCQESRQRLHPKVRLNERNDSRARADPLFLSSSFLRWDSIYHCLARVVSCIIFAHLNSPVKPPTRAFPTALACFSNFSAVNAFNCR